MSSSTVIVGNVTREAELRYGATGTAWCKFSVAVNRRKKDDAEETSFFDVKVFNQQAESVAESVSKGDRVVVVGRLVQESWDKDGEKRTSVCVLADDVGVSLKYATAQVQRVERQKPVQSYDPGQGEEVF